MTIYAAQLSDRSLLRISGHDKENFLDGLISNSIAPLADGKAIFTCLLTPQGKVLHDFLIYPYHGDYLIDVATQDASAITKKLSFYKLRANVDIAPTDITVSAIWGDTTKIASTENMICDPRHPALGLRCLSALPENLPLEIEDIDAYTHHRIFSGIAQGPSDIDATSAFPLEYRLDELNGIDFQKGCFIGQEVTSRAYRKGSLRKALFVISLDGTAQCGEPVKDGDRTVGEIRAISQNIGLALLRLDSLEAKLTTQHASIKVKTEHGQCN